jgi:hypothetical protein
MLLLFISKTGQKLCFFLKTSNLQIPFHLEHIFSDLISLEALAQFATSNHKKSSTASENPGY